MLPKENHMHRPLPDAVFSKDISLLMRGQNSTEQTSNRDSHVRDCFARENNDPLGQAFERKMAIHAGFGGAPVPTDQIGRSLEKALDMSRIGKTAAYIHVPFCETHCLYCGFYTRAYGREESARYTDGLLTELDLWRETALIRSGPVHAVYVGGGTPTSLEAGDLERLITGEIGRAHV